MFAYSSEAPAITNYGRKKLYSAGPLNQLLPPNQGTLTEGEGSAQLTSTLRQVVS